jgi:hypothetical protein
MRNVTPPPAKLVKRKSIFGTLESKYSHKTSISAVFVTYLDFTTEKAEQKAAEFEGFGPGLFRRSDKSWRGYLGHQNGSSMYILIVGMRAEKGVVPESLNIAPKK